MGEQRIRVNVQLSAETHRLLRMFCAEEVLTLKDGVEVLLKAALVKMGLRSAAPPWARAAPQPLPTAATQGAGLAPNAPAPPPDVQPEAQPDGDEVPTPGFEDWDPNTGARMGQSAHVAEALKYTVAGHDVIDENKEAEALPADEEADAFDAQAHYESVVGKIGRKSAILEVQRALDDANWQPGVAPMRNGGAASGMAGPITAAEYEVPPTWVDNAGHTRAQNVARFGEDESVKYWPPGAAT